MSTTYSIQSLAYLKLILHSAKYPSSAVTGILLGYNNPDEPTLVVISDVIPLFHHWTDLNPMMEVALNLVSFFLSLSLPSVSCSSKLIYLCWRIRSKFIVNQKI